MAAQNRPLGKFHLEGIMPAPRGVPKIEVTFDIDANGIVNVSAKDMATGKEQKITITASSGLLDEEIDRMVEDAEKHKADDEKKKKEVETRNQAEQLVYATEKTLSENREKLPAGDISNVEKEIANLKSAIEANDTERIEAGIQSLTQASHKLAEIMYQQVQTQDAGAAAAEQAAAEQAAGEAGAPPSEETPVSDDKDDSDVIDAEFEETKE